VHRIASQHSAAQYYILNLSCVPCRIESMCCRRNRGLYYFTSDNPTIACHGVRHEDSESVAPQSVPFPPHSNVLFVLLSTKAEFSYMVMGPSGFDRFNAIVVGSSLEWGRRVSRNNMCTPRREPKGTSIKGSTFAAYPGPPWA
jgi:hypothetical protein